MNPQLTAAQTKALQKIQNNAGKVINLGSSHDNAKGHLTIHGKTANSLYVRGYIEAFNPETGRNYHDEGDANAWYTGKYYWRLTTAGREALGIFSNLSPTAQALAEASVLRDEAMMVAYKAEGTSREAEADAEYEKADEAYREASAAHRNARVAHGDNVEPADECRAARYGTGDHTHLCVRIPRHTGNHRTAEGDEFTNWLDEPEEIVKPEPFTFEYDATAGILIASALREKAQAHRKAAKGYRANADLGTGLQGFYAEQARIADNNAQLLEDAADKIHKPVKTALAGDTDSLRDMLKLS